MNQDRIGGVNQAIDLALKARRWWQARTLWTVTVQSTDRLYDVAHAWFTDLASRDAAPRALEARLARVRGDMEPVASSDDRSPATVSLRFDERRDRTVLVDGHRVRVSMAQPNEALSGDQHDGSLRFLQPQVLHFHARTQDGQQAVVTMLRKLAAEHADRKPALWLTNQWGSWNRRDDLPRRPVESVVLARGQMERLLGDMAGFLAAEREYVARGLPWHRGYLLHGPPGTGKTSVVRALAAHLGLDLWYAPLGDLDKDAKLLTLIAEVRPRSVLLLEDVDVFHAARRRDDDGGLSMAGLLNALDGVATPHGMVTVLTTNDMSVIDPALLRPGRIDLVEHFDLPDVDQLGRLFEAFYGEPIGYHPKGKLDTTAAYMELFKRHMNDPAAARAAMKSR